MAFSAIPLAVLGDTVNDCTQLADNEQRLACYDGLFMQETLLKPQASLLQDSLMQDSSMQDKVQHDARPEPKSEPEPERPPAALVVDTASRPATVKSEADTKIPVLGSEEIPAKRKQSKTRQNITTFVTKVSKRPRGEYVFELDNGQTWTQISARWIKVVKDDRITILKRSLGGYTLRTSGGASTPVRRVK